MNRDAQMVAVWDPIVRLGHWILAAAFFTAYFTEDDFLAQHVWAGYVVGAILCIRLVWGFVGIKHARFRGACHILNRNRVLSGLDHGQ